jgi:CRP/FNR family transcriptional regulator
MGSSAESRRPRRATGVNRRVPVTFPDPDDLGALHPGLAGLPPPIARRVRAERAPLRAAAGTVLFDAGDPCAAFPLLRAGTVRLARPLANGRDLLLYRLGPGETCAVSASCLLGDAPSPARATAERDLEGAALPAPLFLELVERHGPFRRAVFSVFAFRLAVLAELAERISSARLDERVAEVLLQRGPTVVATHQAIADELGTAREVVSRVLGTFASRGAVRLRRGVVEVLDPASLRGTGARR